MERKNQEVITLSDTDIVYGFTICPALRLGLNRCVILAKYYIYVSILWGGTGGRETGRKGGGRCTGGGRREGGKRDSKGGGKREKKGKITQHCAIFRNRKNAKGREPKNTGREPGLKVTGSGRLSPPYIASRREEEEIWQAFCAFLRNHLDMKKHKSKLQSFVA